MNDNLSKAKINFLINNPFFSYVLLHLKEVENDSCSSMGTDGAHLTYNSAFVNNLTTPELLGVLAHEVYHLALDHLGRRGPRDKLVWNLAADFVTNENVLASGFTLPKGCLLDKKLFKMSAEEVYDLLREKVEELSALSTIDDHSQWEEYGGASESDKSQTENGSEGEGKTPSKSDKTEENSESTPTPRPAESETEKESPTNGTQANGSQAKGSQANVSEHVEKSQVEESDTVGVGEVKEAIRKLYDPTMWKERIIRAATLARMQGKLPGNLESLIDDLLNPELDWRVLLRDLVSSTIKSNYKLLPPNKRYLWMPLYLPSTEGQSIEVAVAIDTSGSMSDEDIRTVLSEVKGIVDQFDDYKILLFQCDAAIQEELELTPYEGEFPKKALGRGGTDFRPVFERIAEKNLFPSCLIYLTDGYGTFPDSPPEYPVIWIMITEVEAPFGETIRLKRLENNYLNGGY